MTGPKRGLIPLQKERRNTVMVVPNRSQKPTKEVVEKGVEQKSNRGLLENINGLRGGNPLS